MNDVVIRAEGLGKAYQIHHEAGRGHDRFSEMLTERARRLFRRGGEADPTRETFWALRDISFEVREGEVVGIIGRNGAGKTTLLKILSRITEPTEGRAEIRGRVASLLEVGTGFHPELTGRENVFLNGAILGMSRAEIRRKFDEIVDFAGVEKFLDTPVKRYSSGMRVRLAFAVAAHLEPEILIVDEVLAVGDAEFQRKCLGKMGEVARGGRTVLFVSHNLAAVRALCPRAMILLSGKMEYDGIVETAINTYVSQGRINQIGETLSYPSNAHVELHRFNILNDHDLPIDTIQSNNSINIYLEILQKTTIPNARMIIKFIRVTGEIAFCSTDHNIRTGAHNSPGLYCAKVAIPKDLLNSGLYMIYIRIGQPGMETILDDTHIGNLNVVNSGSHGSTYNEKWPGAVAPKLIWTVEKRNEDVLYAK